MSCRIPEHADTAETKQSSTAFQHDNKRHAVEILFCTFPNINTATPRRVIMSNSGTRL